MSTDNALDALTARMLEAVKNTRESADRRRRWRRERCRERR